MTLTLEDRKALCHALGLFLDGPHKFKPHRKSATASSTDETWMSLVHRGLAFTYGDREGRSSFLITEAGCLALTGMPLSQALGRRFSAQEARAAHGLHTDKKKKKTPEVPITRRLNILIECGEKTCASSPGKFCKYLWVRRFGTESVCSLFPSEPDTCTVLDAEDGWTQRCQACLEHDTLSLVETRETR